MLIRLCSWLRRRLVKRMFWGPVVLIATGAVVYWVAVAPVGEDSRESPIGASPETISGLELSGGGDPYLDPEVARRVVSWNERSEPEEIGGHHHIKRSWVARLEPDLPKLAEAYERGELENGFRMPLFDGEEVVIRVRRYDVAGPDRGVLRGSVEGEPGSMVVLAFVGAAESGTIQMPARDEVYRIRSSGDGAIVLSEIDVGELGECGVCAELADAGDLPESGEPPIP